MHQLAGVLLHVNFVNADDLSAAVLGFDLNAAVPADGEVELADLVRLGKIGVEIIFAVEFVVARDLAVERESRFCRVFHNRLIQRGQNARHACADRAAVGVGFAAEFGGAGAEYLGFGGKLYMHFQTHNGFPYLCIVHCHSAPFLYFIKLGRTVLVPVGDLLVGVRRAENLGFVEVMAD